MQKNGIVSKIIFKNDSNQYVVFAVELNDGQDETMVGFLSGIEEGMYITAFGEYKDNKQYGLQFVVEEYEISMPGDLYSMERYLASGAIKGIGEIMAKRIIKRFGMDSFRIIENEPERLSEIKGISERKANEIGVQFVEKQEMREALMFLSKFGISPALSVKIFTQYGNRLYRIVKENPYQIAEDISGVGFKTADLIAMSGGVGAESEFRIRAAIIYTLNRATGLGHIYLPKRLLISWTGQLLNQNGSSGLETADINSNGNQYGEKAQDRSVNADRISEMISIQLKNLELDKKVVVKRLSDEAIVYTVKHYESEKNTAQLLLETRARASVPKHSLKSAIEHIEAESGILLDKMQKEAVYQAAENGVLVITGGPGTGKTTTINAIIRYFEMEDNTILLAAPTGRAAKRMTEATGHTAQTIHRLLELSGGVDEEEGLGVHFERNGSNPLEADVIIIDEMSMVDQSLMYALMQATLPGMHLIFVGDENQLPSVGAGNVLKDIIGSGTIPVVALTRIFRQEADSRIVENAHKINHGEPILMDNKCKDFFYIPRSSTADVAREVGELISHKLPGYVGCSGMDIQVLTPMRSGPLGVESMNRELQSVMNPPSPNKKEKEMKNGDIFREGDKVMQIRNNYKLEWGIYGGKGRFPVEEGMGIFNGDIGIIREIDEYNEEVVVVFDDDKEVKYPYNMLDELELSYAITIHKSQGSEYPAVVLPIFSGSKILMNRNLLYTAVTRAKSCVVIVGSGNMVGNMIQNNDEQERYSTLEVRLKEMDAGEAF